MDCASHCCETRAIVRKIVIGAYLTKPCWNLLILECHLCSGRALHDIKRWKCLRAMQADFVRLDQDILTPLAGKKKLYTFETNDFWEQIKTPGWV